MKLPAVILGILVLAHSAFSQQAPAPINYETARLSKIATAVRTNEKITEEKIQSFIQSLDVKDSVKKELLAITPFNYTGV